MSQIFFSKIYRRTLFRILKYSDTVKKSVAAIRGSTMFSLLNVGNQTFYFLCYNQLKHNYIIAVCITTVFCVIYTATCGGPGVRYWLRRCAASRTVRGSIPGGVIGFFSDIFPSDCFMALGSTQPLEKMSTRNIS